MCDLRLAKSDKNRANKAGETSDDTRYLPFQTGSRFSAKASEPSY